MGHGPSALTLGSSLPAPSSGISLELHNLTLSRKGHRFLFFSVISVTLSVWKDTFI